MRRGRSGWFVSSVGKERQEWKVEGRRLCDGWKDEARRLCEGYPYYRQAILKDS